MEAVVLGIAFLVMLVGLVGVVVPVLPGLLIVWLVGVTSLLWQGTDGAAWLVAAWLTGLFALGTLATVLLPARRGREAGATTASFVTALLGAVLGFFVLPVAGFLVGFVVGLLLGERGRLGEWEAARRSTLSVLRGYGIGVLIELVLGVTMVGSWLVAVVVRFG
ncbi:MAG: DUF456 domain-containing protein [Nitriliruptor sp.]|nr:MAG: DUF456 domain-containing protein [Nitriliruptor sp.]